MGSEFLEWRGCYDDGWKGIISPASFGHPAKFSRGLITRIFAYLLETGMVAKGDCVVDPFGGIGTGGIIAASLGLRWFGCELEPRFHAMGLENFALHRTAWEACGDPLPVLVCGDSRKLRENLAGVLAEAVVCSPPFHDSGANLGDVSPFGGMRQEISTRSVKRDAAYGSTPGQLGAMKPGDVATVVSSPPYSEGCRQQGNDHHPEHLQGGELGAVLTSYGSTPGNIANLPAGEVAAVVSSPPYEGCDVDRGESKVEWESKRQAARGRNPNGAGHLGSCAGYTTEGNIGNEQGETFWQAARDIVAECRAILRPGGWSAWVCKDFVRNKARVPFCDDWCRLLESCGFTVTTRVHVLLVKENRHPDLFGGERIDRTERKSFFRRLYESKYPENKIDHEEVIFATKV